MRKGGRTARYGFATNRSHILSARCPQIQSVHLYVSVEAAAWVHVYLRAGLLNLELVELAARVLVPIIHPSWSRGMLVLVKGSAESISSTDFQGG